MTYEEPAEDWNPYPVLPDGADLDPADLDRESQIPWDHS